MAKELSELSLSVAEMPTTLREALGERGHPDGEVMTLSEAFAEYSAWHFGDRAWGYTFAHMANEFHKRGG